MKMMVSLRFSPRPHIKAVALILSIGLAASANSHGQEELFAVSTRHISVEHPIDNRGITLIEIVVVGKEGGTKECEAILEYVKKSTPGATFVNQDCVKTLSDEWRAAVERRPIRGAYLSTFYTSFPPFRKLMLVADIAYPPVDKLYPGYCERARTQYEKRNYRDIQCALPLPLAQQR